VSRPLAPLFDRLSPLKPLAAMLKLAPTGSLRKSNATQPGSRPPETERRGRVAILSGCAQPVLDPGINEATIRLLTRLGVEVVVPQGEGCCGALVHHMGKEDPALDFARSNVDAWTREIEGGGLDAIIITTSGCGTTVKDYGHMLRLDPHYAEKAPMCPPLQGHNRISGDA
jgi:glycolate oxidase iron-sulfur subunit